MLSVENSSIMMISDSENFGRFRVSFFFLQNEIFPFMRQGISVYVGKQNYETQLRVEK